MLKKILYVTFIDPLGSSGQNIATKEVLHALSIRSDIELHIICPENDSLLFNKIIKADNVFFLSKKKKSNLMWNVNSNMWLFWNLRKIIKDYQIDILIARPGLSYLATKYGFISNLKTVLLLRGMLNKTRLGYIPYKILNYIEMKNVSYSSKVYVTYSEIYDKYSNTKHEHKIEVFTNAVNPDHFQLQCKYNCRIKFNFFSVSDIVIGFVGTLKEKHNVDILIKSLTRLSNNVKLLVVGDGSGKTILEELVKEYDLSERVVFTGRINHEVISEYIGMCDLMYGVVDNNTPSNPIKCYEYLSVGRPIITTRKKEFLFVEKNDFGMLIDSSNSVDELVSAIQNIISNISKYNDDFSDKSRGYICTNNTWNKLIDKIIN